MAIQIPDSLIRNLITADAYDGYKPPASTGGNDSNTSIGNTTATGKANNVSPLGHEDRGYTITARSELRGTFATVIQPGVSPSPASICDPNEADVFILRGSVTITIPDPKPVPTTQQIPGFPYRTRMKKIRICHVTEGDADVINWPSNVSFGGYATAPNQANNGIYTVLTPGSSDGSGSGSSGSGSSGSSGSTGSSGSSGSSDSGQTTQTISNLAVWVPGAGGGTNTAPVLPTHAGSCNVFLLQKYDTFSNWIATWEIQDASPGTDTGGNPTATNPTNDPSTDPDLTDENGQPVNPGQPDGSYPSTSVAVPTAKKASTSGKGSGILFWLSQAIPFGISKDGGASWKFRFGSAGVPPASTGTGTGTGTGTTGTTTTASTAPNPPWTTQQSHAAVGSGNTIVVAGSSGLYTTTSLGSTWNMTQAGSMNWVATDGSSTWIATGSAGQFYSTSGATWISAPSCPVSSGTTYCDVITLGFLTGSTGTIQPTAWADSVVSGTGTQSSPWSQLGLFNNGANVAGAVKAAGVVPDGSTSIAQANFNLTYTPNTLTASLTFTGGGGTLIYTYTQPFSGGIPVDSTGKTTQSIVLNLALAGGGSTPANFTDAGTFTLTIPVGWTMPVDSNVGATATTYTVPIDQTFGGGKPPVGPATPLTWTQEGAGGAPNAWMAGGPTAEFNLDGYPSVPPGAPAGTSFAFYDILQQGPDGYTNTGGQAADMFFGFNIPSNFTASIDSGNVTAALTMWETSAGNGSLVPYIPNDQSSVHWGAQCKDASGNIIGTIDANAAGTSGWAQIGASGTIPSGTRSITFYVWTLSGGGGFGRMYAAVALPTCVLTGSFPAQTGANNNEPVSFNMKQATATAVVSNTQGYAFMVKPTGMAGGSITTPSGANAVQAQTPTWSPVMTLPTSWPANFISAGNVVLATTIGAPHIYSSTDGQTNWKDVTPPLAVGNLHIVLVSGNLVAVDQTNGKVFISPNYGLTWTSPAATPPFDGKPGLAFLTNAGGRLVTGHLGTTTWFYSDDNGQTWKVRGHAKSWTAPLATTNTVPAMQEIDG